jgi:hypothetical protein
MFALLGAMAVAANLTAVAQNSYPMIDKVADKVIAHYQNSSCQQFQAAKGQPPSGQKAKEEQRAVEYLKQNPQAAQYFINKVAAPIANKMFECGMIP